MKASAIARYPASVGCGSPFEQIEGERAEPSLLARDAPGRVERREHVRDTGARRRRGSCDGRVERAVERLGLCESIGLGVPRSGHDDLGGRRGGPKLLEDRVEARSERRDRARRARLPLRRQRNQVVAPQRQGYRADLPGVSPQEGQRRLELGSAKRVVQLEAVGEPGQPPRVNVTVDSPGHP